MTKRKENTLDLLDEAKAWAFLVSDCAKQHGESLEKRIAALSAARPAVGGDPMTTQPDSPNPDAPNEWQLVPKEPTHEMRTAGRDAWLEQERETERTGLTPMRTHVCDAIFRAMLAAAPPDALMEEVRLVLDTCRVWIESIGRISVVKEIDALLAKLPPAQKPQFSEPAGKFANIGEALEHLEPDSDAVERAAIQALRYIAERDWRWGGGGGGKRLRNHWGAFAAELLGLRSELPDGCPTYVFEAPATLSAARQGIDEATVQEAITMLLEYEALLSAQHHPETGIGEVARKLSALLREPRP